MECRRERAGPHRAGEVLARLCGSGDLPPDVRDAIRAGIEHSRDGTAGAAGGSSAAVGASGAPRPVSSVPRALTTSVR